MASRTGQGTKAEARYSVGRAASLTSETHPTWQAGSSPYTMASLPDDLAPPPLKAHYDEVALEPKKWPELVRAVRRCCWSSKGFRPSRWGRSRRRCSSPRGTATAIAPSAPWKCCRLFPHAQLAIFPRCGPLHEFHAAGKTAVDNRRVLGREMTGRKIAVTVRLLVGRRLCRWNRQSTFVPARTSAKRHERPWEIRRETGGRRGSNRSRETRRPPPRVTQVGDPERKVRGNSGRRRQEERVGKRWPDEHSAPTVRAAVNDKKPGDGSEGFPKTDASQAPRREWNPRSRATRTQAQI